jgi:hypothetical protein
MTLKPIREVFNESFWRELRASQKAAQRRAVQVTTTNAQQDAVVLHLSSKGNKKQDESKK